jgi:hypothetical protein
MELTLVGVVHRDPEGHLALRGLLEQLSPDALSVEFSPLGLLWRETNGTTLLQRLDALLQDLPAERRDHYQAQLVREALRVPFEFLACREYGEEHALPVHCVDLNRISREHLPLYEKEILTRENLMSTTSTQGRPLAQMIDEEYRTAAGRLAGDTLGLWIPYPWKDDFGRARERFLGCRVRQILMRHDRVVHVGGWTHMVLDQGDRSLASLLRDFTPRRVLLRVPHAASPAR